MKKFKSFISEGITDIPHISHEAIKSTIYDELYKYHKHSMLYRKFAQDILTKTGKLTLNNFSPLEKIAHHDKLSDPQTPAEQLANHHHLTAWSHENTAYNMRHQLAFHEPMTYDETYAELDKQAHAAAYSDHEGNHAV